MAEWVVEWALTLAVPAGVERAACEVVWTVEVELVAEWGFGLCDCSLIRFPNFHLPNHLLLVFAADCPACLADVDGATAFEDLGFGPTLGLGVTAGRATRPAMTSIIFLFLATPFNVESCLISWIHFLLAN